MDRASLVGGALRCSRRAAAAVDVRLGAILNAVRGTRRGALEGPAAGIFTDAALAVVADVAGLRVGALRGLRPAAVDVGLVAILHAVGGGSWLALEALPRVVADRRAA